MKEIPLTQGKFCLVDDEDYDHLNQWKWRYSPNGYASRSKRVGERTISIYMHRLIMKTPQGKCTDHISGNKLDNRRENLRVCSHSQNTINGRLHKDAKGKYKGVWRDDKNKKWMMQIKILNKRIVKRYETQIEAARAYDNAAKLLHGEFASLNFGG